MGREHQGGESPDLMRRFLDQIEGRCNREYPHGRLGPTDEGRFAMAMVVDRRRKVIMIDFGMPVTWFGMTYEEACQMRDMLSKKINELELNDHS